MTNNIQSASVSDRGLSEKRPQNEDSYLEMSARGIFAVADGVGGAQAGDVASQMAMEVLGEAFANSRQGDVEELMQIAIERANESIYQLSHQLAQLSTMATTIVALHVAGNIATIGHVGDSRIYRVDSQGNLFRETQDHSVVEEEVRAGRMTAAQAANHPSRNIISRALGAEGTVEVDMKTIMFEPNTTFLLCSDGITRHVDDFEIRDLLKSEKTPADICAIMKDICYQRGAEDNLTAVIVRVPEIAADQLEDIEERTAAAPRPPLVNSSILSTAASAAANGGEIPTQDLSFPESSLYPSQNNQNQTMVAPSLSSRERDFSDDDTVETDISDLKKSAPVIVNDETDYHVEEKSGSAFGKIFGGLVLLLIGAALGAAGYHFWKQSQPQQQPVTTTQTTAQEQPKIEQMQSPNIPFSAFEKLRREVDRDPGQYITANGTPKDAADYYLLGRANLLQGKNSDAWNNFVKAKEQLSQMSGDDKQMLANEISIGASIANVSAAQRYFKAEKDNMAALVNTQSSNTTTPGANTNTANKTANANK